MLHKMVIVSGEHKAITSVYRANITWQLFGEFSYRHIHVFEIFAQTETGYESKDYVALFQKTLRNGGWSWTG